MCYQEILTEVKSYVKCILDTTMAVSESGIFHISPNVAFNCCHHFKYLDARCLVHQKNKKGTVTSYLKCRKLIEGTWQTASTYLRSE